MLTGISATSVSPMNGASSEPTSGASRNRLISGPASVPINGNPVTNASKSVTSVTRTLKVWVVLPAPVFRFQVRYGRIV